MLRWLLYGGIVVGAFATGYALGRMMAPSSGGSGGGRRRRFSLPKAAETLLDVRDRITEMEPILDPIAAGRMPPVSALLGSGR